MSDHNRQYPPSIGIQPIQSQDNSESAKTADIAGDTPAAESTQRTQHDGNHLPHNADGQDQKSNCMFHPGGLGGYGSVRTPAGVRESSGHAGDGEGGVQDQAGAVGAESRGDGHSSSGGVGVPDSGGWECVAAEFGEKGTDNEGLVAFWVKMPEPVFSIHEARKVGCALEMYELVKRLAAQYEDTDAPTGIECRAIIAKVTGKVGVPHV